MRRFHIFKNFLHGENNLSNGKPMENQVFLKSGKKTDLIHFTTCKCFGIFFIPLRFNSGKINCFTGPIIY